MMVVRFRLVKAVLLLVFVVAFTNCDVRVDVGDAGNTSRGGGTAGGSVSAGGGTAGGASMGGGSGAAGGSSTGGGAPLGGGGLLPVLCSGAMPCPSGQFCFNGLCAIGCQTNANCAADQYCDTEFDHLCHNRVVPTCTGPSSCLSTQICVSGLCSTPPPVMQCDVNAAPSGMDGCNQNSICFDSSDTRSADPKCYTFPACAADKTCPVGTQGAVCNDGLIPNKARICVTGLCRSASNCPANWICWKANAVDVLGACSNRGTGSPCTSAADCVSGNCTAAPGFPGICL